MKILFLQRWLVMGGIERVLINYFKLLKDIDDLEIDLVVDLDTKDSVFDKQIPNNINVTYLFDKNYAEKRRIVHAQRNNGFIAELKYKYFRDKEKYIRSNKLNGIIRGNQYDVIINFSSHFDSYIKHMKFNIPVIRFQHSSLITDGDIFNELKALKYCNYIVNICNEMADENRKISSYPVEKIRIIYNPLITDEIISLSKENVDLPGEEYFVQVARLDHEKQHALMIDIYAELVKKGVKENLYIIGDGPEFYNLKAQIKKLELENRCFLLGEIENPYPYIKNAKLFLHTSKLEGFGVVLLESLILNTPIVTMACKTGLAEISNNGKCGALVELNNKDEFIQKVLFLNNDHQALMDCKTSILEHKEKFSENSIRENFLELLKLATKGKS